MSVAVVVATVTLVAVVALATAVTVLLAGVDPAAAADENTTVNGTVDLDVSDPDEEFETGEEASLEVVISNDGEVITAGTHPVEVRDRVTAARSADVRISDSPAEIDVRTGEQPVGTIDSGDSVVESFDIFVDGDAAPGEYDLELTAEYRNVTVTDYERINGDAVDIEERTVEETATFDVTIEVEDEARFDVLAVDHAVQVDDAGNYTLDIENSGSQDVEDVVVTAEATDQDVFFGSGGPTSDRAVGDWVAGERKQVTFRAGTTDEALTEPYPIDLTVAYTDPDEDDLVQTEQTELEPLPKQNYTVEALDHAVSIGDDGVVSLELTNDGPQDLTDASVTVSSGDGAITFPEADGGATAIDTFVGDWEAEESERLEFRTAVGSDAVERNYTMEATISARDENDSELSDRTREFGFEPEPKQVYTVENVSHDVVVGDDGLVEFELKNHGPQRVSDATVTVETGDSALTFADGSTTTQTFVDDWGVGETKTVSQRVGASDAAAVETYTMEATISARDENDSELGDRERTFGLTPAEKQRYTVENVGHDVAIGDEGILELELKNRGPLNVTDAAVELGTDDPVLSFGSGAAGETVELGDEAFETGGAGAPTTEAFVGDWNVNETRTIAYHVSTDDDALSRNYTVTATVDARDERDSELSARTREFGFEPLDEQSFAIENTEHTLRVGEEGDVAGSVTNDADRAVEGVVVRLASDSSNVLPRDTEYAIGSLDPGETAAFSFRIGISAEAQAGPRVFEFETRYRSPSGQTRLDDSQDIFVEVEPERDSFAVAPVDATVEAGDAGAFEVELENNRDEPVENVRAKVFPDSPVSSDDDEAFVSALDPGESETVVFDLGVDSDAVAKEYPVSLDVRYDDERGETQLSGTYQVPVAVEDGDESGPSLLLVGTALLLVGGLGLYFRERLTTAGDDLLARLGGSGP